MGFFSNKLADGWDRLSGHPESNPSPRTYSHSSTEIYSGGVDRDTLDRRETQEYWKLYKTTPQARTAIQLFAKMVMEPGYFVDVDEDWDGDEEDLKKDLQMWLSHCGIVNGEVGKDFSLVGKVGIIQREVRGTALIELVPDKDDEYPNPSALKFVLPETMEVYTREDSAILISPDDTDADGVKLTEDGKAAAYVQYDDGISRWSEKKERRFTRDEIVKLVRDADVGEVFGDSVLRGLEDRIEGYQKKLHDNDQAIEHTVYPFWLIKFGVGNDGPWSPDEVKDFMKHHNPGTWKPGMKQGVAGDVEIQEVGGNVPNIYDSLEHDVNFIMSGLPIPKYALGGFEENVNQFVSAKQENALRLAIREAREELENEFTPVLLAKAENLGYDVEEGDLKLRIAAEDELDHNLDLQDENVLRYVSDAKKGQNGNQSGSDGAPTDPTKQGGSGEPTAPTGGSEENQVAASVWDVDADGGPDYEKLADPRFVSTEDENRRVRRYVANTLIDLRQEVLDELDQFGEAPTTIETLYDGIAAAAVDRVIGQHDVRGKSRDPLVAVTEKTVAKLGSRHHTPPLDVEFGSRHVADAEKYAMHVEQDTRSAGREMLERMRVQLRRGFETGDDYGTVRRRIEGQFTDGELRRRAGLVSRMTTQSLIQSTRLEAYEESDEVVGVRLLTHCGEGTPDVCRTLGGCHDGEGAAAYFDDGPISEQWQEQAEAKQVYLYGGFDPLPAVPPFHWGCQSEIAPIPADVVERAEADPAPEPTVAHDPNPDPAESADDVEPETP